MTDPAHTDLLTGLPRHEALLATVDAAQHNTTSMALVVIDLRSFKHIGDRYGIPGSDQVLRDTALRLSNSAESAATVARIGGDEFAVLLAACDRSAAERAAETLRHVVQQPRVCDDEQFTTPASVGTVMLDRTAAARDVLEAARAALRADRARHPDSRPAWVRLDN